MIPSTKALSEHSSEMMQRIPEPQELMGDHEQALAYASANFSEANDLFVRLLTLLHPGPIKGRALDLGCGPADIPITLLHRHPDLKVDAVDGAQAMLDIAQQRRDADEQVAPRLDLQCEMLPSAALGQARYNLVLSNSLLHHLGDPNDLWLTLKHCARKHATVLIMDLARPNSQLAVDTLVETYAMNEPEVLREDFRNSLHAAYTVEEVRRQLYENGLSDIEISMVSDRHWAARGHYHPKD